MEENKRTDSGYTGEYGNPVEHNDEIGRAHV